MRAGVIEPTLRKRSGSKDQISRRHARRGVLTLRIDGNFENSDCGSLEYGFNRGSLGHAGPGMALTVVSKTGLGTETVDPRVRIVCKYARRVAGEGTEVA